MINDGISWLENETRQPLKDSVMFSFLKKKVACVAPSQGDKRIDVHSCSACPPLLGMLAFLKRSERVVGVINDDVSLNFLNFYILEP